MSSGHIDLKDALGCVPGPDGKPFATLFRHGTLAVELYIPVKIDKQTPHSRDEVYVVVRGTGMFFDGATRRACSAGTLLFVAAGQVHRFEDFSDDFVTWVLFYGPEGGESEDGAGERG